MNKKGQSSRDLFMVFVSIIIGVIIGYILWGQGYSNLDNKYIQLQGDYQRLNSEYVELNQTYISLQQDTKQILINYQQCIGREDFFTWVNRLSSLAGLAKLIGLI
ncbi:MAG: hypothetical protein WC511_04470 [Candidatus Pacearchaeota archaeon]